MGFNGFSHPDLVEFRPTGKPGGGLPYWSNQPGHSILVGDWDVISEEREGPWLWYAWIRSGIPVADYDEIPDRLPNVPH